MYREYAYRMRGEEMVRGFVKQLSRNKEKGEDVVSVNAGKCSRVEVENCRYRREY